MDTFSAQNCHVNDMKQRLRKARLAAGMNAAEVGRALGISRASVSAWENPKRRAAPSKDNLKALANLYKCTVDNLVGHVSGNILPTAETPQVVPLFTLEDFNGLTIDVQPQLNHQNYIFCPVNHSRKSYALTVTGMSMVSSNTALKSYPEGTIIYCDPALRDNVVTGQNVIARLDSGIRVFKQYVDEDGKRWLRALNPEYSPIYDDFTVEAVIIGSFQPE